MLYFPSQRNKKIFKAGGHCCSFMACCLGHIFCPNLTESERVLTELDLNSTCSRFFMPERDSSPTQLKPFPYQRSATRRVETCNYLCPSAMLWKKPASFKPMRLKEMVYCLSNLRCYSYTVVTNTYSLPVYPNYKHVQWRSRWESIVLCTKILVLLLLLNSWHATQNFTPITHVHC